LLPFGLMPFLLLVIDPFSVQCSALQLAGEDVRWIRVKEWCGEKAVSETVLRIFSYLPNPRVWKSLIAAKLLEVEVVVTGDKPAQLGNWLWDAQPRTLTAQEKSTDNPTARQGRRGFKGTLYKTDAFLQAHPFGTVPAGFSSDGQIGIFESNSILRSVVRAAPDKPGLPQLYGAEHYTASRIDSFLDANLVFAREAQVYLLGIESLSEEAYQRMLGAYEFYLDGIEAALTDAANNAVAEQNNSTQTASVFLVGGTLSIADISFVCDFAQFLREGHYEKSLHAQGYKVISSDGLQRYPKAYGHMLKLSERPEFAEIMGGYLNWFRSKQ
jgi:glutathione S-transferase